MLYTSSAESVRSTLQLFDKYLGSVEDRMVKDKPTKINKEECKAIVAKAISSGLIVEKSKNRFKDKSFKCVRPTKRYSNAWFPLTDKDMVIWDMFQKGVTKKQIALELDMTFTMVSSRIIKLKRELLYKKNDIHQQPVQVVSQNATPVSNIQG